MKKNKKTKQQIISWLNNHYSFGEKRYQIEDGIIYKLSRWIDVTYCMTRPCDGEKFYYKGRDYFMDHWQEVEWKDVLKTYKKTKSSYRSDKKRYQNYRNRKNRRKTNRLIQQNKFDQIPSENCKVDGTTIAWDID